MTQCAINQFFCLRCHAPRVNCVCQSMPRLHTSLKITLLTHEKECKKSTNSGFILQKMLAANIVIWDRKNTSLTDFHPQGLKPHLVLVYPIEPTSTAALSAKHYQLSLALPKNTVFILLDGTWQECRKMLNQSPDLQSLPRLHLSCNKQSRFSLRRNNKEGTLSTCETGALLINQYEPSNAKAINLAFDQFIHAYTLGKNNQKA